MVSNHAGGNKKLTPPDAQRASGLGQEHACAAVSSGIRASSGRTTGPCPGGWLLHAQRFGSPPLDGTLGRVANL